MDRSGFVRKGGSGSDPFQQNEPLIRITSDNGSCAGSIESFQRFYLGADLAAWNSCLQDGS